jgi:exopolyphosphatase / guanosine-5'-triphosphate,3'-diphosphate pyrophosphatase
MLDRQMRVTRLGEGVDTAHKLAPEAMDRTLAVLGDYRKTMDRLGVEEARMVATSAARDASNSSEFLTAAHQVTGVVPELLSGDQEGRLSFRGATADLPGTIPGAAELIVDIGGGSTELVAGVPGASDDSITVLSLNLGCVRVTERFFSEDPPAPGEIDKARSTVAEELQSVRERFSSIGQGGRLVGLAGTVSTLGSLSIGIEEYERDRVHHLVLSTQDVNTWLDRLGAESASDRAKRPGMEPGRADVIVGGVLILAEVMAAFDKQSCLVSEADILDGLVASLR